MKYQSKETLNFKYSGNKLYLFYIFADFICFHFEWKRRRLKIVSKKWLTLNEIICFSINRTLIFGRQNRVMKTIDGWHTSKTF